MSHLREKVSKEDGTMEGLYDLPFRRLVRRSWADLSAGPLSVADSIRVTSRHTIQGRVSVSISLDDPSRNTSNSPSCSDPFQWH